MEEHTFDFEIITESPFRVFVRNMYYSNKDERLYWHMTTINFADYFKQNKWFLKRQFKNLDK